MAAIVILRVTYTPVPETDIEYGQGAIERNELVHYPLTGVTWLIQVPAPGDLEEWRQRLDASVRGQRGTFAVQCPSAEEQARVDRGEIPFQQ